MTSLLFTLILGQISHTDINISFANDTVTCVLCGVNDIIGSDNLQFD